MLGSANSPRTRKPPRRPRSASSRADGPTCSSRSRASWRARQRELDEAVARQAAALCRKAGADPEAIPAWAEEGRHRRAAAGKPPFSGGLHP